MQAWVALSSGKVFSGKLWGAPLEAGGEIVFHTGMTGYQEILTDPSYAGQVVVFTTAHLGNTGLHDGDNESSRIHPSAIIVRDFCRQSFRRRSVQSLDQGLRQAGIPALSDVDTRALTKALRDGGTCRAWVGTGNPEDMVAKARQLPGIAETNWVQQVTTPKPYLFTETPNLTSDPFDVAVLDCGVKKSILNQLVNVGCRLNVYPAHTPASELATAPTEGVFLSNGPGDPAGLPELVNTVRELLAFGIPIFGICLGHQILARALGGTTIKLPFGHHGANHPVQNLETGRVEITSQNHNYAVPIDSLSPEIAVPTHLSLNDQSVEGLMAINHWAYSVQHHPEAAPGPHDSHYLFQRFCQHMHARRAVSEPELKQHAASD
ncbi:MAG: carbamoyl-phosphate synthase small subunit [Candidatus Krumholzibacteriia bacterium]